MMRKAAICLCFIFLISLVAPLGRSQNGAYSSPPITDVSSGTADPTGNACTANQLYVQATTGNLYSCDAGVFAKVGPSAGGGGTVTSVSFTGGLISVGTPTTTPALTVAGTSGGIPYFSSASTWASSAAGTVNTLMKWGGAGNPPIASSVTDNGTTVVTTEPLSTSAAGALSQAALGGTGTILATGGNGTTTFPYFYLNNGGAAVTTFNTVGTVIGINTPSGFNGDDLAFFANGTRVLTVNSGGSVTSNSSFIAGSAAAFSFSSRSALKSASDGVVSMTNAAGTAFTRLQLGGTTSSFPAIQVNGTSLQAELADGSAQTGWSAATYSTATNCSSGASPAVCAAAAAGSVAIPAGALQTLQVNTSAVTANSQILLTIDEGLGTKLGVTCNTTIATLTQPVVTARSAGASFTIEEPTTTSANPVCVSYMVFN